LHKFVQDINQHVQALAEYIWVNEVTKVSTLLLFL